MGYIQSSHYKPVYTFHRIANEEDILLGVELEVDMGGADEEVAKSVLDILNASERIAYCMHDGSLTGGSPIEHKPTGFEIATMPCTLDYHKTVDYEKAFKFLSDKGYKSHDTRTCGLHIHVNRTFLGPDKLTQDLNISKILYLVEKNWDNVASIARRDNSRYAKRVLLEEDDSAIDIYYKSKDIGKYAAVNLEHKDTVEFRMFRGTLKYDTFMCTLEFVYKLCQLVKTIDIYDIQKVTWLDIENTFSSMLKNYIIDRRKTPTQKEKPVKSRFERFLDDSNDAICSPAITRFIENYLEVNPSIQRSRTTEVIPMEHIHIEDNSAGSQQITVSRPRTGTCHPMNLSEIAFQGFGSFLDSGIRPWDRLVQQNRTPLSITARDNRLNAPLDHAKKQLNNLKKQLKYANTELEKRRLRIALKKAERSLAQSNRNGIHLDWLIQPNTYDLVNSEEQIQRGVHA